MKRFNFIRKATMLAVAALVMTVSVSAEEKGDKAVGASVYLGTGNSYNQIGIGGKFRYNILDFLRGEAQATYYLPKYYWSMADISVNAHYLLSISDGFTFYPLAGLGINYFMWDSGWGVNTSNTAINLGCGIDFGITESLFINAEATYRMSSWWDRLTLSGGIIYKF